MPSTDSHSRRIRGTATTLLVSQKIVPELGRFLLSGVLSTVVNLTVLAVLSYTLAYQVALVCGLFAGFVASFLLAKLFTFRAHTWTALASQVAVFTIIYASGAVIYWFVALESHAYVYASILRHPFDKLAGAVTGASLMALTSYAGHRLFTFRRSQTPLPGGKLS